MSDVADILRSAADLLEPEGAWTQRANARNAGGVEVSTKSPNACSWCALGALDAVTSGMRHWPAVRSLERHLEIRILSVWNDEQTGVEPVLGALRAAAEAAS